MRQAGAIVIRGGLILLDDTGGIRPRSLSAMPCSVAQGPEVRVLYLAGLNPPASAGSGEPNGEPTPAGVRPRQATPSHGWSARWPARPHPATSGDAADTPEKRKVGSSILPLTTTSDQCKHCW
jgi:hypothetical protein